LLDDERFAMALQEALNDGERFDEDEPTLFEKSTPWSIFN
jgi:hypothetical protein